MKLLRTAAVVALLVLTSPLLVSGAPDVGVTAIIQPTDTVAPGYVMPQARVANVGDSGDSTRAWFTIERPGGGFYESFSDVFVFPPAGWLVENVDMLTEQWNVGTANPYTPPGCAVINAEPTLAGNDDWLISPRVKVNPSDTITFWYRALGSYTESLEVWVSLTDPSISSFTHAIQAWDFNNNTWDVGWADFSTVGDTWVYIGFRYKAGVGKLRTGAALDDIRLKSVLYSETARLLVEPGETVVASFANWRDRVGRYVARCSVYQAGDMNVANDVRTRNVAVVEPPSPPQNWTERESMPRASSGRDVKHGGSLVLQEGDGMLYAVKGNKTADFYRFNPATNTWVHLQPVPDGPSERLVKKGGCLAADGERFVYLVKGNNTIEFWRYDPDSFGWQQRADVPEEPSGKRVKGGGDVAFVTTDGSDYVYLLKGYRHDFMRYNIQLDQWEQRAQAPAGSRGKWYGGSFLVWDRGNRLYAHQSKYHALWRYDIVGDSWGTTALRAMPYEGRHGSGIRSKKSKDGGSAAWYDNQFFALKGGNTQMFYRYDVSTNTWTELDTLPRGGSSGRRRRVSAGGDMVAIGNQLYALKGNNTRELWRFTVGVAAKPEVGGVMAGTVKSLRTGIQLGPNPASGFTTVRYHLPKAGAATVRVFDALGREVLSRSVNHGLATAPTSGVVSLDLRSLSAGIYLVRLDVDDYSATQKLVIQH